MPQSLLGWALTIGVPVSAVAIALALMGGGATDSNVNTKAAAVCSGAERELKGLPQSPRSVAQGLEIEHRALAIYRQEVAQLQELAPKAGDSFRAAVADDRSLLAGLSSMMARPDFVELSLTLPGHPDRIPGWLREWMSREQALLADARAQFSQAGIPACEKSLS
jgi:hypothetical protein